MLGGYAILGAIPLTGITPMSQAQCSRAFFNLGFGRHDLCFETKRPWVVVGGPKEVIQV